MTFGAKAGIEQHAVRLRRQLVATLVREDALFSEEWCSAFLATPRHLFVPAFQLTHGAQTSRVDGRVPEQRDLWLSTVYSDTVVVTHVAPDGNVPTSSSTQPSLMAMMLEALSVSKSTHRVLEVGTGTGYNAALLCHRLGSSAVTSIDISSDLLAEARIRLAALGYSPVIAQADGAAGYPLRAPYDRIIATCRVDEIPPAWLRQCEPGAVIVTSIAEGVARLVVDENGHAYGGFLPTHAAFMPLRSTTGSAADKTGRPSYTNAPKPEPALTPTSAGASESPVNFVASANLVDDLVDPHFRFLLRLVQPSLNVGSATSHPSPAVLRVLAWWQRQGRPQLDRLRIYASTSSTAVGVAGGNAGSDIDSGRIAIQR